MTKIAMIGAGSVVFSRNMTGDILQYPEFKDATIAYMDVDRERLEVAGKLCRKIADAIGATPTIQTTMDRKEALKGADFVINMVQIGGFDSTLVDFEIPRKYGINFTIADTTGPGGLFRALRTYPMLSGLCRDMEQVCPNATLLNYSNPMSMNMQTVFRTSSVRAVGLCHSVQGTYDQLMGYLGIKPSDGTFTCAGINHMAFYLSLKLGQKDLYPDLFAAMQRKEVYDSNKVRFELMRRLGHFVTESSEHNAEYCSWFIPRGKAWYDKFDVPIDEYLRRCDGIVEEFENLKTFARSDKKIENVCKSHEYGSTIIRSITTGEPSVIYGNMPNHGAIDNLPKTAIVEAPTLVDRTGLHFAHVGTLPPQLVGYMQPHITQHELFIRAAMEGRRDHIYQAVMFDPATSAILNLDQIVEMCDELIAGHGDLLPKLEAKTLVPTSGKAFGHVDPKVLRASWDKVQNAASADAVLKWHVIGPFKGPRVKEITLNDATPIDADLTKRGDGSVDLAATHLVDGAKLSWTTVTAARKGFVNLATAIGAFDFVNAYGYAEVVSEKGGETELRVGSDDGVALWVNGARVHAKEIGRGFHPDADRVVVKLKPGLNRILVKCDNYTAGWGFGVAVPGHSQPAATAARA